MSFQQTCTLLMSYNGTFRRINFPECTAYEEFIKLAMDHFEIPIEVFEFVEITSGKDYIFKKDTFENYLMLFPEPETTFEIDVKFDQLIDSVQDILLKDPLEDLNAGLKRKHQLFIEPEMECEPCEPQVKRQRIEYFNTPDMMETL